MDVGYDNQSYESWICAMYTVRWTLGSHYVIYGMRGVVKLPDKHEAYFNQYIWSVAIITGVM